MALSRIKVWVNGDVLTAPDLNAEFDNILGNPVALIFPSTGAMDFGQQVANNFRVGTNNVSTNEGGLSAATGLGILLYNDGTTQARILGPASGLSRVRGLQGSLISNIGSFQALGYQMTRSFTGSNPGNQLITNVSATSSFSVNTQLAGPVVGGRDQAAAFTSTDVHFYAFISGRNNSTNVFGICSSKPPPLGPTGADYWAYLGSVKYNTATSVIQNDGSISGSQVTLDNTQTLVIAGTGSAAYAVSPTAAATHVPTIASHIKLRNHTYRGVADGAGALACVFEVATASSAPGAERTNLGFTGLAAGTAVTLGGPAYTLSVVNGAPAVWFKVSVNTGTSGLLGTSLVGYTVPNGDN